MSSHFHDLEMQARALPLKEKAALARLLIEELDMTVDADVEQLWIDESQRRYDAADASTGLPSRLLLPGNQGTLAGIRFAAWGHGNSTSLCGDNLDLRRG